MSVAVYVHIPFCPIKCGYCDFNSYAMTGDIVERTARAIEAEIRGSKWKGTPARTIFFGGGTPTYLPEDDLLRIFNALVEVHPPIEGCEITSEANPGTVDAQKFSAMRRAGFNRISMGAQSFVDEDLLRLDRVHRAGDIDRAFNAAREAGFDNVNLDLMFALPHQSVHAWRRNLDKAFSLAPDHISLYCLTIEENTAFYKKQLRGQLDLPDEDDQVAMYEECLDRSRAAGYEHYEISNFAKPGRQCQHNLEYWRGNDYAGYGPGAVGCMDGSRYTNLKHPRGYSDAVEAGLPIPFESETLSDMTRRNEHIMLGIRLREGIDPALAPDWANSIPADWMELASGRLRLTREGTHFASEVASRLMQNE